MCTAFVKKGNDLLFGYNLDLSATGWDYKIVAKPDIFYIGIKVGATRYKTHGVNKNGAFGNLPYMNDPTKGVYRRGTQYRRLDLLIGNYISGKLSYAELLRIASEKELVNVPNASMHSLIADGEGHIAILEPGLGCRELTEDYAVMSNFPLLEPLGDCENPFYGKARYDRGVARLEDSGADFTAEDGLRLLSELTQDEPWATRVSFVYSANRNTVYYTLNRDFSKIFTCSFAR